MSMSLEVSARRVGRNGGQVVRVLAFYSDVQVQFPLKFTFFSVKYFNLAGALV